MNLRRVNISKGKVLHLGNGKPCCQYKLGDVRMEHSSAEENLGVLVDYKLDMSQQCASTVWKVNCTLGCIKRSVVSRSKEVILLLCSMLVRPHLQYCVQMWSPQYRREVGLLEHTQRNATEMIQGMKHFYGDRQRQLGLLSLDKRRLWEDVIAAFDI